MPLWVAHIVGSDSADRARGRTKGAWSRKNDKFTPDSKIVLYAKSRKLLFVTDEIYVNANPFELSIKEAPFRHLEGKRLPPRSRPRPMATVAIIPVSEPVSVTRVF